MVRRATAAPLLLPSRPGRRPHPAARLVVLLFAFVSLALHPSEAAAQPYAVYVFTTAESGDPVDDAARLDSVDDVQRALQDRKYQQLFTIVDSVASADLLIEVAWRGQAETTSTVTTSRRVPGASSPPLGSQQRVMQNNLRLKLTVGRYEHELWAVDPGRPNRFGGIPHLGWRELASRAVERTATWARQNSRVLP